MQNNPSNNDEFTSEYSNDSINSKIPFKKNQKTFQFKFSDTSQKFPKEISESDEMNYSRESILSKFSNSMTQFMINKADEYSSPRRRKKRIPKS